MPRSSKVSYVSQEPSFIRKFKEKVGYKEADSVESKKDAATKYMDNEPDEREDREDERPQVVVLESGDLDESEAERLGAFNKTEQDAESPSEDGKILFKKPVKRTGDACSDLKVSSKKKKTESELSPSTVSKGSKPKPKKEEKVKKSSLLSFDEDEEDG